MKNKFLLPIIRIAKIGLQSLIRLGDSSLSFHNTAKKKNVKRPALLLENSFFFLLENGGKILLEKEGTKMFEPKVTSPSKVFLLENGAYIRLENGGYFKLEDN